MGSNYYAVFKQYLVVKIQQLVLLVKDFVRWKKELKDDPRSIYRHWGTGLLTRTREQSLSAQ